MVQERLVHELWWEESLCQELSSSSIPGKLGLLHTGALTAPGCVQPIAEVRTGVVCESDRIDAMPMIADVLCL